MPWNELNNYELQAVRRLLCLDVSEAAEFIGRVSSRTWQYWESGRSKVPDDVETEMYALVSMRNQVIESVFDEINGDDPGCIRWYHTLSAFKEDFPESNSVLWRLHQSVCAYLFAEGGNASLDADAPLNKDSFLYQWFAGTTNEQLKHREFEQKFKGLDE
ncbi:DUF1870 family protein [Salinisphaera sp. G21_0]|uniref:Aca2/YdiL-like domain-containing protein n=1 Tax=Salinisphaera sp. G21_0 TaxID=2821094 RepID=UPI001ADC91FE|nr:DUF1870 family protein [Salinisphaera sp. G21_0]MBO9483782.1 DUF1870 family protein [Salinisphaera sp. G21_0]